ncbi:MAG TPA: hypothetical protein VEU30_10070 [Thermoanaerobaculia bacterium]|nr:hypothetical protein [Thermoanaerobaculia bacterium]
MKTPFRRRQATSWYASWQDFEQKIPSCHETRGRMASGSVP